MKKIILPFLVCFVTAVGWAKGPERSLEIDLDQELKSFKSLNIFESPLSIRTLSSLAKVKGAQVQRRFDDCQKSGLVLLGNSEVKEWLATTIMECGLAAPESKKKSAELKKIIEAIGKHRLEMGPWKAAFGDAWSLIHVWLYDDSSTQGGKEKILESWARKWDLLSKEQQSAWMESKADGLMNTKKNFEAAYYLKQSQDLFPSKNLNDKVQGLLGLKSEAVGKSSTVAELGQEQKLEDEIQKLLTSNQNLAAQKLILESLKQFPQGKQAKKYREKALEIYFSQNKENQEEALRNLLSADGSRLYEWAQTLHRRGEFKATLAVTEKALTTSEESAQASALLWMAGRSAQFIGKEDKALLAFEQLIQKYGGAEEVLEARFRSGLILFRKGEYSRAATYFEQVRNANRDRYQLNAWYWLVRCLQNTKNAEAESEMDGLIARYPFSYYGLRLRAEKQQGVISFPDLSSEKSPEERSVLPLLPHQHQIWKRFKILAENGWVLEAQQEISGLPQPVTSKGLWKWMQLLGKAQQSASVIVLTNRLLEQDASYRSPQFLTPSFPRSYSAWIEPESKKYNINPFLIRSLVRQESAFSLRAVSTSSAMGLMQMIPPTADEIARKLKMKVQIPEDMYRPEVNVPMGTFYVSEMLKQFAQNVPMALAAYNAGPVRLKSWLELRPSIAALRENHSSEPLDELWFDELPWTETSFYVKAILRNVLIYKLIDKGPVHLTPVFWSDFSAISASTPASIVVK